MDLEKLIAVCEAATDQPWAIVGPSLCDPEDFGVHSRDKYIAEELSECDAAFIAAAREHFPEALKKLQRLRELLQYARAYRTSSAYGTSVECRGLTPESVAELRKLLGLDLPERAE